MSAKEPNSHNMHTDQTNTPSQNEPGVQASQPANPSQEAV